MGTARPDREGTHRAALNRNRKIIYATQTVCAICGQPVDFGLKYPDPMSPTIDHIIPVARGGHPSDIENLQLAHRKCNRDKSDKLPGEIKREKEKAEEAGADLPWSVNWLTWGHTPRR